LERFFVRIYLWFILPTKNHSAGQNLRKLNMKILKIAFLGSAALFTSPALAFDGNAIQLASLTEDMVTATEGYPAALKPPTAR
jgi:hypothetical protein